MKEGQGVREWEFFVAGVKFHGLHTIITDIRAGHTLDLDPEPGNPHDPNAIRILYEGIMIGYVPKKLSKDISEHVSDCVCKVVEVDPSESPWKQLKAQVMEF